MASAAALPRHAVGEEAGEGWGPAAFACDSEAPLMPVLRCSNGKYRIGSGPCIYKTRASAERAYAGYRGAKAKGGRRKRQ